MMWYSDQHLEENFLRFICQWRLKMIVLHMALISGGILSAVTSQSAVEETGFLGGIAQLILLVGLFLVHKWLEVQEFRKTPIVLNATKIFEWATFVCFLFSFSTLFFATRWVDHSNFGYFAFLLFVQLLCSIVSTIRLPFRLVADFWGLICFACGIIIVGTKESSDTKNVHIGFSVMVTIFSMMVTIVRDGFDRQSFEASNDINSAEARMQEINQQQVAIIRTIMPLSVARLVVEGKPVVDVARRAAVICTSLCRFTKWCADKSSHDIVSALDSVYRSLDECANCFGVTKVTTWFGMHICCLGLRDPAESVDKTAVAFATAAYQIAASVVGKYDLKVRVVACKGELFGAVIGTTVSYHVVGEVWTRTLRTLRQSMEPGVVFDSNLGGFAGDGAVVQPVLKAKDVEQELTKDEEIKLKEKVLAKLGIQQPEKTDHEEMQFQPDEMDWLTLAFASRETHTAYRRFAYSQRRYKMATVLALLCGTCITLSLLVGECVLSSVTLFSIIVCVVVSVLYCAEIVLFLWLETSSVAKEILFVAVNFVGMILSIGQLHAVDLTMAKQMYYLAVLCELQGLFFVNTVPWFYVTLGFLVFVYVPCVTVDFIGEEFVSLQLTLVSFVLFSANRYVRQRENQLRFLADKKAKESTEKVAKESVLWRVLLNSVMPPRVASNIAEGRNIGGRSNSGQEIDPRYGGPNVTPIEEHVLIFVQAGIAWQPTPQMEELEAASTDFVARLTNFFHLVDGALSYMEMNGGGRLLAKVKSFGDILLLATQHGKTSTQTFTIRHVEKFIYFLALGSQQATQQWNMFLTTVITVGSVMGAILGAHRLAFEMVGNVVQVGVELLHAAPPGTTIASEKFVFYHQCAMNDTSQKRIKPRKCNRRNIQEASIANILSLGLGAEEMACDLQNASHRSLTDIALLTSLTARNGNRSALNIIDASVARVELFSAPSSSDEDKEEPEVEEDPPQRRELEPSAIVFGEAMVWAISECRKVVVHFTQPSK